MAPHSQPCLPPPVSLTTEIHCPHSSPHQTWICAPALDRWAPVGVSRRDTQFGWHRGALVHTRIKQEKQKQQSSGLEAQRRTTAIGGGGACCLGWMMAT